MDNILRMMYWSLIILQENVVLPVYFVKVVAEEACPQLSRSLPNSSLSRRTITRRIERLSDDIVELNTEQLAIFIRVVDRNLAVREEFLVHLHQSFIE